MAFNMFKKKKNDDNFPSEEKEEVLGDLPDLPELPKMPGTNEKMPGANKKMPNPPHSLNPPSPNVERFKTGFRTPGEMGSKSDSGNISAPRAPLPRPPEPPEYLPPYEGSEPLTMPKPSSMMLDTPFKNARAQTTQPKEKPKMFIRVDKYKEIMSSLQKLKDHIEETKEDLEEMDKIDKDESSKLKESAEVVLEIESLLEYLEDTFTSPQD